MRVIRFKGPQATQMYEILYDGLLNTTRGFEAPSETRVHGRILDKMESIGIPTERGGVATFTLAPPDGEVVVEDAEYQLMAESLKAVRWLARAARVATAAMELFANAPAPHEVEAIQHDSAS